MMRPGIKDPADIESTLGLNVFATVPHTAGQTTLHRLVMERRPGNHVLASTAPSDPAIESLRSLRTALQFGMLDAPNNIVLFSGPTRSEERRVGKDGVGTCRSRWPPDH